MLSAQVAWIDQVVGRGAAALIEMLQSSDWRGAGRLGGRPAFAAAGVLAIAGMAWAASGPWQRRGWRWMAQLASGAFGGGALWALASRRLLGISRPGVAPRPGSGDAAGDTPCGSSGDSAKTAGRAPDEALEAGGLPQTPVQTIDVEVVREIVTALLARRGAAAASATSTATPVTSRALLQMRMDAIRRAKRERRVLLVEGPTGTGVAAAVQALVDREAQRRPVVHVRVGEIMRAVRALGAAAERPASTPSSPRRISISDSQSALLHIKHTDSGFDRSNESFYMGDVNSPSQIFWNPFQPRRESQSFLRDVDLAGESVESAAPVTAPSAQSVEAAASSLFYRTLMAAMGVPEHLLVPESPAAGRDWPAHVKSALQHLSTLIPKPPLVVLEDAHLLFHEVYLGGGTPHKDGDAAADLLPPAYAVLPQFAYSYVKPFDPYGVREAPRHDFVRQKSAEPLLALLLDLQQQHLADVVVTAQLWGAVEPVAARLQRLAAALVPARRLVDVLAIRRLDERSFGAVVEDAVHPIIETLHAELRLDEWPGAAADAAALHRYLLRSTQLEAWLDAFGTDLDAVDLYIAHVRRCARAPGREPNPTVAQFLAAHHDAAVAFLHRTVLAPGSPAHDALYWEALQALVLEMIMKGGVLRDAADGAPAAAAPAAPPSPAARSSASTSPARDASPDARLQRRGSALSELDDDDDLAGPAVPDGASTAEASRRRAMILELGWWGVLSLTSSAVDSLDSGAGVHRAVPLRHRALAVGWQSRVIGRIFEQWFNTVPAVPISAGVSVGRGF